MKKKIVKLKIPTTFYIPHDSLFAPFDTTFCQVWQIKIERICILIFMQDILM